MNITKDNFNTTLQRIMDGQSQVAIRFQDKTPSGRVDRYVCKLQRNSGQRAGFIDCICKLNGENAWQVPRTQAGSSSVGRLLLLVAGTDGAADAAEFFA